MQDQTQTNLVNLRRTIYLTIMSSMDFEESGHKLMKINIGEEHKIEIVVMLIECCSQEKTYIKWVSCCSLAPEALKRVHDTAVGTACLVPNCFTFRALQPAETHTRWAPGDKKDPVLALLMFRPKCVCAMTLLCMDLLQATSADHQQQGRSCSCLLSMAAQTLLAGTDILVELCVPRQCLLAS